MKTNMPVPAKCLGQRIDYQSGSKRYRWQTPRALEARGILAGGGAKRSHRKRHDSITRPERAPEQAWFCCEDRSGVPAGTRTILFDLSRWLRFAPPPANFRRPSGAGNNFAEFASGIPSSRTPKAAASLSLWLLHLFLKDHKPTAKFKRRYAAKTDGRNQQIN